jgi:hypothetical protein
LGRWSVLGSLASPRKPVPGAYGVSGRRGIAADSLESTTTAAGASGRGRRNRDIHGQRHARGQDGQRGDRSDIRFPIYCLVSRQQRHPGSLQRSFGHLTFQLTGHDGEGFIAYRDAPSAVGLNYFVRGRLQLGSKVGVFPPPRPDGAFVDSCLLFRRDAAATAVPPSISTVRARCYRRVSPSFGANSRPLGRGLRGRAGVSRSFTATSQY